MAAFPESLLIFDTTLRDGEQSPGCSMTQPEKLRVAQALAELGVDVIEAGFPAASRGDWESVNAVSREVQDATTVNIPDTVGYSGRHALRERVKHPGFELDDTEFNRVFEEFKALADRKKELFDGDIEALVLKTEGSAPGPWRLLELTTVATSAAPSKAFVRLGHTDGRMVERSAEGDGPVDAAFKAIEAATGIGVALRKFEVRAVTEGEDAQGEALVYVEYNLRTYRGSSVSTNIVESGAQAFLEVINRIELSQPPDAGQRDERGGAARIAQAAV